MTKLAIIAGLVVLLLAAGYGMPPEIRRATNAKLAETETAAEDMIDTRKPGPRFSTASGLR